MSDLLLALGSAGLVALSVLLGWRSFGFAEEGATPDEPDDPFESNLDLGEEMMERAARARARWCARVLFNIAALCLVASIPLGYADAHRSGWTVAWVVACALVLIFAIGYAGKFLRDLWLARRQSAFESFYYGQKLANWYKNREAVEALFFSMNDIPFRSVFRREWFIDPHYPTAEQLVAADQPVKSPAATGNSETTIRS
jgi:hypothetical protein